MQTIHTIKFGAYSKDYTDYEKANSVYNACCKKLGESEFCNSVQWFRNGNLYMEMEF